MINHHQSFEALVRVVNQALGGSSSGPRSKPKAPEPKTAAEMDTLFSAVFG